MIGNTWDSGAGRTSGPKNARARDGMLAVRYGQHGSLIAAAQASSSAPSQGWARSNKNIL